LIRPKILGYEKVQTKQIGYSDMRDIVVAILLPVLAYLIGAIPFGLIVVRRLKNTDIRTIGSGNIGATNVRRASGTKAALGVLMCDCLKGFLPIASTRLLFAVCTTTPSSHLILAAMALTAVMGHMFPVYLRFKPSGKGVATALGGFLALTPLAIGVCIAVFIGFAFAGRRISIGSLAGAATLPVAVWFTSADPFITVSSLITAALIMVRHRENLSRLLQGCEPPFR
jgi:glycerol-3-phosphate acyltransferase PlsY